MTSKMIVSSRHPLNYVSIFTRPFQDNGESLFAVCQTRLMALKDQRAQLDKLPHAEDAGFKSGNRQHCLEGTRKDVLDKILSWARDP